MIIRPTPKELTGKFRQAVKAVSDGRICILDPEILARDAFELGYRISDLSDILTDLLSAVLPEDYIGHQPPEKSYEDKIKGIELFAFKACSEILGCNVYLKFGLKGEFIWVVSLHEFENKGGKT
jgi:hypothetical protein